ncbi:HlyD family secretion protein [Bowmanella pacifica]|uniref:Membrane protein n=1 Tax=Bowmanella pacifica TaxID=502051 RepID=A0A918DIH6_9ALTE|nr:efflux RND transporter periplasmic adaptor subunit [Bowmanella pacifica]GGO67990.1 membrane protein [Bowmanella pacifica]
MRRQKYIVLLVIVIASVAAGAWWWSRPALPDGIVTTNGRLEATQIDVATKVAGRVDEVLVQEGQMVARGDLLARIDSQQLVAKQAELQSKVEQALLAVEEAKAGAEQRQSQLTLAESELARIQALVAKKLLSQDKLDQARAQFDSATAALKLAKASTERLQASVNEARAAQQELQSLLDDTQIRAPGNGRVQYKLAQAGEVLAAGGRVVTLLDLSDVYMTVFLPADVAGKLGINDEARLILDPIPNYVVPAKVSFIAADAQFTPKSVETQDARDSLMFRVKLAIDPALLQKHQEKVKTGVRGMAYVRASSDAQWPASLTVNLP